MHDAFNSFIEAVKFSSVAEAIGGLAVTHGFVWLLIMAAVGVVVGMYGYKIHKFVIIGSGMILGAIIGFFLSGLLRQYIPNIAIPDWVWLAGCSLLFGGLGYGLFHSALALFGAAAGGVFGWLVGGVIFKQPEKAAMGVAVGIILGGAAAFIMKRFFVTLFTSILGAYLITLAILPVLKKYIPSLAKVVFNNELVPLSWMIALAALSFWFQYHRLPPVVEKEEKKRKKTKKKTQAEEEPEDAEEDEPEQVELEQDEYEEGDR